MTDSNRNAFAAYSDYEEYLKVYHEQQRLEKYQRERVLARPKTSMLTVTLHTTLFLVVLFGFLVIWFVLFPLELWMSIFFSAIGVIGLAETYGRFLSIKIVECYQHYASEEKRRMCCCVPSCSEYAILCLKKYGLIRALLKIRKRLFVTCKGIDYIIDNP